ncbi:MAG: hypothetical protein U1D67_00710, partial [Dehalococcoidia bacterium]|nr:hypothetical protein [Dehalococcoidia bacterium]
DFCSGTLDPVKLRRLGFFISSLHQIHKVAPDCVPAAVEYAYKQSISIPGNVSAHDIVAYPYTYGEWNEVVCSKVKAGGKPVPPVLKPPAPKPPAEQPTKFKVGDEVTIIVKEPELGWGEVKPGDVGVIAKIVGNKEVVIDFPDNPMWQGSLSEIALAEEPEFPWPSASVTKAYSVPWDIQSPGVNLHTLDLVFAHKLSACFVKKVQEETKQSKFDPGGTCIPAELKLASMATGLTQKKVKELWQECILEVVPAIPVKKEETKFTWQEPFVAYVMKDGKISVMLPKDHIMELLAAGKSEDFIANNLIDPAAWYKTAWLSLTPDYAVEIAGALLKELKAAGSLENYQKGLK